MDNVSLNDLRQPVPLLALIVFLVLVVGVGALIGSQTIPGPWYEALDKPFFTPPDWVFGPVWFTLYVMIAVAGWRIWMLRPGSAAMGLWGLQMLVNWLWSPVFFIAENLWLALAVIIVLLAAILAFVWAARRIDRVAALLFLPYAAWVGFATVLNLSLALMN